MARVVIVTGASGGLGSAVVSAFLRAGDQVAGVARKWPAAEADALERLAADLGDPAACEALVRGVIERHGRIDALVHVAGGFAMDGPVEATSSETWRRMLDLNLWPVVNILRPVLVEMKRQRFGAVALVGSMASEGPAPDMSAYAASKAAVVSLARSAAAECKPHGVTVNVVLPGTMNTAANRAAMPDADPSQWVEPESVAAMLDWLCSPAGRDVTGAAIPITGRA